MCGLGSRDAGWRSLDGLGSIGMSVCHSNGGGGRWSNLALLRISRWLQLLQPGEHALARPCCVHTRVQPHGTATPRPNGPQGAGGACVANWLPFQPAG
jgi:hypothetical protein